MFPFARPRRVALHMAFVGYPIDVLFLDAGRRVVEIKRNFRPWRCYRARRPARFVIELPADRAEGLEVGDKVVF